MNGHWDLTRGPQFKNNCVDCHDPHAPSFPKMIVGFNTKDRFNHPIDPEHAPAGVNSYDH
jgi:predicted CXXCH cytochrome family protein